jgi:hypothetical protein
VVKRGAGTEEAIINLREAPLCLKGDSIPGHETEIREVVNLVSATKVGLPMLRRPLAHLGLLIWRCPEARNARDV